MVDLRLLTGHVVVLVNGPRTRAQHRVVVTQRLVIRARAFQAVASRAYNGPPLVYQVYTNGRQFTRVVPRYTERDGSQGVIEGHEGQEYTKFHRVIQFA